MVETREAALPEQRLSFRVDRRLSEVVRVNDDIAVL